MGKNILQSNPGILLLIAIALGFWPTLYNLLRDDEIFQGSSFQHPLYPLAFLCVGIGAMIFGYYVSMHVKEKNKFVASITSGIAFIGFAWLLTGFSIFA